MSLAIHAASAPAGELLIFLLEIWHPSWATPLRYSEDTQDWTVMLENDEEVTFPSTGLDGQDGGSNEEGIDERGFRVPDLQLVLWRRLEALIGDARPVKVTLRKYLTTDLSAPAGSVTLEMADPTLERDRSVSFTATTANLMNRSVPTTRFNLQNAPGLRS